MSLLALIVNTHEVKIKIERRRRRKLNRGIGRRGMEMHLEVGARETVYVCGDGFWYVFLINDRIILQNGVDTQ